MSGDVKASLMFHMPVEMKAELENAARAAGQSTTAFVRDALADKIGYDLPPATSRGGGGRKYASPEERIAAQKDRDKARRALIKNLMDEYKAKATSGEGEEI